MEAFLDIALGLGSDSLTWWQMAIRAVVVFFVALAIVRIGNHRIFGKQTAFDIVLGIIYGSVLSRAITGNSPFFPTLVAAMVLVMLHKGLAVAAYHSSFGFGNIIKGKPQVLIQEGEIQWETLKRTSITENDLKEALRNSGAKDDLTQIKTACLERSGKISLVLKD